MSKSIIRIVEPDDILRLMEVELEGFVTPWSFEALQEEVRNHDRAHYLVAEFDEQVVGYAGLWIIFDEGHITRIVVDPKFRRKGIGKSLVKALMKTGTEKGCDSFTLEVSVSNIEARNLYGDLGFEEVGLRKGYYESEEEDAVIMWHNPPEYIREGNFNERR